MSDVLIGIDVGFKAIGIATFSRLINEPFTFTLVAWNVIENKSAKYPAKGVQAIVDTQSVLCVIPRLKEEISKFVVTHDRTFLSIEIPTGGSRSARAAWCMGLATMGTMGLLEGFRYDWLQIKGMRFLTAPNVRRMLKIGKKESLEFFAESLVGNARYEEIKKQLKKASAHVGAAICVAAAFAADMHWNIKA